MPNPRKKATQRILAALVVLLTVCSCGRPPGTTHQVTLSGPTMGTRYMIKLVGLPRGVSAESLAKEVDERLHLINQQMSTYVDDSEISLFNRAAAGTWFDVSRDTASVVQVAQATSEKTEGAFDITVGPLVDLWHFGPNRGEQSLPSDEQIVAKLERVGYSKLAVRSDPPALMKTVDKLRLDLSAIAKGYAVDAVAELLERHGISSYMVEIGGEIRVSGSRPGGNGWRIGIESPKSDKRKIKRVVELKNVAMATSGDYRNFFEVDGKRYSHTINPANGRPVEHNLASVTVLEQDCMTADALATALLVLGPDRGIAWANENDVAALLISRTENGLSERASKHFTTSYLPD